MKNTFGTSVAVTLFGESHGAAIGAVIDGLCPGIDVDDEFIACQLNRRRPAGKISTARHEADAYEIMSGVFNGKTTGTPLCIVIRNKDTKSADYGEMRSVARPSHADYTAYCKYHGYEDYRGGGHFSGRITAPLVAAGAIIISALENKGIRIATHIHRAAGIDDRDFADYATDFDMLNRSSFPVLSASAAARMKERFEAAAENGDSVGGILQTAVTGLPKGVGEPWFDTVESELSHMLFSVPAVKGVEFGAGFALADMNGSTANDSFCIDNGDVCTKTNNNGGINGGITNGMPVVFRTCIKPTPSIYKPQQTIDFISNTEKALQIKGRHDPAIIHRAAVVVDSVTAISICDMLCARFGTDWLCR